MDREHILMFIYILIIVSGSIGGVVAVERFMIKHLLRGDLKGDPLHSLLVLTPGFGIGFLSGQMISWGWILVLYKLFG